MKMRDAITDVFFDLDHTLWDFDKNSALTFTKIFSIHDIRVQLEEFLSFYEPINMKYWKLYREDKIDKPSLRFGRLNDAFDALNYEVSEQMIHQLSTDYIAHLPSFNHLFEHTFDILEYLYEHYELHVITNGFEEVQYGKLSNSNIHQYFKTVTVSEMVGVKKPNPIIFNHALDLANTSGAKSVMIGDNFEADILGARDVGMEVIYFNGGADVNTNGIPQIKSLIELKTYL